MDELLGEFIAETLESLESLSVEVVEWENDPTDRDRLDAFFRFFHTVKGSCGFLNLPRFERLSHVAEDVLSDIRTGSRSADENTVTAVLAVMDHIALLARCLADGDALPDEALDDPILAALTHQEVATASAVATPGNSEAESAKAPTAARERGPRTIRISLSLIDQLMNGVSDMVLARNELARKLRDGGVDPDVESSFERLSTCVADMRDTVSRTRMQRVDRLFAALPRMVRDLNHELGKSGELTLEGGDVEMDREMIEMVIDPLTHIVRNALDHGIENPAERLAAGKPAAGQISIAARQSGNQIVIEIADDGRGIDTEALVAKAIRLNALSATEAAALTEAEKLSLIFHAGLSTAKQVSAISGRGVGMDVVRTNVERLGGVVTIDSRVGVGTMIHLRVPMTLTIIPGLILRCGTDQFAIPRGNVIELLFEDNPMVSMETVAGAKIATIRGERIALVDMREIIGCGCQETSDTRGTLLLVRSPSGQPYALRVDSVDSNEELVIRPASPQVMAAGIFAGMTLPDTGRPMLLLDPAGIAQVARLNLELDTSEARSRGRAAAQQETEQEPTLQALHFLDMAGKHRLIPLSVVERIEDIPASRFGVSGNDHFVRVDDAMIRLANAPEIQSNLVKTLHLRDGSASICLAVSEVIDILTIPVKPPLAAQGKDVAGIYSIEGNTCELVDTFSLFASTLALETPNMRTGTCLVEGLNDDVWARTILAPLLVQAGYEVVDLQQADKHDNASPRVILTTRGSDLSADGEVSALPAPVLHLRPEAWAASDAAGASVYRYDRSAMLTAIADLLGKYAA